ncbi:hypothetical protein HLRTI_003362 [Halorhabdus tiamatea SARL4B]|uniref:Uncharacterized protein n=1 Tax=Halorhabdus tiamatea SARL4B TaxID=1033806 RepID=F7PQM8_9EURY|nr:DUF5805 domain-containing protein [Halorhabdus tiamatea]ERJ04675.1 hypothetical protein HLRTI_003362 [Halorhabdus tiamatea SARL4B]CCQ32315.1 conserved hypothetical protein [Halorhabdus tiamatea SARL4B]
MPDEEPMSRTAVKTYVPAYQKEAWQSHADELDMSQSEFVRTMVQAGRRQYTADEGTHESPQSTSGDNRSPDEHGLADRVRQQLSSEDALTWDELVAALTDDVESRLEEALDELQADNVVKYSGRDGGYILLEP